jgi:hypothetical protein
MSDQEVQLAQSISVTGVTGLTVNTYLYLGKEAHTFVVQNVFDNELIIVHGGRVRTSPMRGGPNFRRGCGIDARSTRRCSSERGVQSWLASRLNQETRHLPLCSNEHDCGRVGQACDHAAVRR